MVGVAMSKPAATKPFLSGFCNPSLPRTAQYDPHHRCSGCDCPANGCHHVRECGCPRDSEHNGDCPMGVPGDVVIEAPGIEVPRFGDRPEDIQTVPGDNTAIDLNSVTARVELTDDEKRRLVAGHMNLAVQPLFDVVAAIVAERLAAGPTGDTP
jgi:hypothetical protein